MGTISRLAGMVRGGGRTGSATTAGRRSRTGTTQSAGTTATTRGVGALVRRFMR